MKKFDLKKWINSACKTRHPQDSLDKHMVDLEMKLQMVSEEIATSLEEQSVAALLHVPRAIVTSSNFTTTPFLSAILLSASLTSSRRILCGFNIRELKRHASKLKLTSCKVLSNILVNNCSTRILAFQLMQMWVMVR
ncbi:uncharacterized protein LOC111309270 [Durio zibethinus]|uniref:Conserved oligomeric Golgi complex subunit 7 n=1 Tax=Durio zibethinus TaxID=66656 RepID=A0A6P6AGN3_DURZI|nr:uncharacterized protein LOC111309270 [Durio zibethinus]